MSYILNALKKAERDRMREEPQDLDDFVGADWDPYQVEKSSNSEYKLAAAIAFVAALLFFAFYSLTGTEIDQPVVDSQVNQVVPRLEVETIAAKTAKVESIETADPVQQPTVQADDAPANSEPAAALVEEELQLPQVTIAGHIYIRSGSPKNRIFVGDTAYYVGDRIEGEWIIEAINFDSLSIRSGNLRSELPLR